MEHCSNIKFTPRIVVKWIRNSTGTVLFLESGNSETKLHQIISEDGNEFARMDVSYAPIARAAK